MHLLRPCGQLVLKLVPCGSEGLTQPVLTVLLGTSFNPPAHPLLKLPVMALRREADAKMGLGAGAGRVWWLQSLRG